LKARFRPTCESHLQRCAGKDIVSWGPAPGFTMSRAVGAKRGYLSDGFRFSAFLLLKRVNDKQHNRNRNARIGDVKGWPGIGVADVQIKKEKIDHMSVKQTIGQISQNACKEKRQRYITPRVRAPTTHQQNCDDHQCYDGNYNEESVVTLERSKG